MSLAQLRLRPAADHLVRRLAETLRVRSATARCLVARGVTDPAAAKGFVDPRLAALRPPAGLAGMSRAVARIADAVVKGERIGVFGDYDVDGVTTAALLTSFLRSAGATVECAVARRDAGYGYTPAAAADFAKRACTLVITGDCGTNDIEAINAGAAFGIETIIVDHHTVPPAEKLAVHPAFSLVNPFRADSTFPFRGMASVGLGFYVAAAVRTELRDRGWFSGSGGSGGRREPDVRELLDLVALGTIADLVPLTNENRILTSLGLRRLESRARPGIAALIAASGMGEREVDAHAVAWKLAPRLNAPGRLGAAEPSLSLLLSDADAAQARAAALEEANTERRQLQEKVVGEALAQIEARFADGDPGSALVIAGEGWPTGIVGLVASKLVDKYQRPAFVVGIDPVTGLGRGSARTPGNVNLYDALSEAARSMPTGTCLDRFGGHAAAAGFTVKRESFAALQEALGAACGKLAAGSGPIPVGREVDAEVKLAEVDERLAAELAGLGPFGQHNPAPLLVNRGARVWSARRVGTGDRHLKLTLEDSSGAYRSAIGFGLGDRPVERGAVIDLLFVPKISIYQGRRSAELEVLDLEVVQAAPIEVRTERTAAVEVPSPEVDVPSPQIDLLS